MGKRLDEQDLIAARVMYDRVGNYSKVARHFGIAQSTIWKYIVYWEIRDGSLNQRNKIYRNKVARKNGYKSYGAFREARKRERQRRIEIFVALLDSSLGNERGKDSWLAREVGISRQAVYAMKRGEYIPRGAKLKKICRVLKASNLVQMELRDRNAKIG